MIAEVLTRKISRPFKGLADYLNGKPGRVENSFFLNCSCDDFSLNLKEIKTHQELSNSTADKTYHFVISCREGEKLNKKQIEIAAKIHLKSLGLEKHQALVTAHNDTSNFHIHVGVNKVCPETGNIISPYKDYEKLDKTCKRLEKMFGLQPDNRIGMGTNKVKKLYDGRQSFQEWVKDLTPEIMGFWEKAENWQEFHSDLAKFNLCIRRRGAGFVVSDLDEKLFMKASAVDRKLSKNHLEGIFGPFEKADLDNRPKLIKKYEGIPKVTKKRSPFFTEFLDSEKYKKHARYQELSYIYDKHSERILSLKKWYRDCKMDLEKDLFIGKKERFMVMQRHQHTMKKLLNEYYQDLQNQKKEIMHKTSPIGWNTFILNQAQKGRGSALYILRKKEKSAPLIKDNFISMDKSQIILPGFHTVSRHGELIYNFGEVQVRDCGNKIAFFGDLSDKEGLVGALKFVSKKNGKALSINGTKSFKSKISESIHDHKLNLKPRNLQSANSRGDLSPGRGR